MNKLPSLIVCLLLMQMASNAQTISHSPYSRFGIGTLELPGGITQRSMGGITSPLYDPFAINFANPASYSSMLRTNFQVGVGGKLLTLKSTDAQAKINSSQISEMGLVFKKQTSPWAFALGLAPYSNSGYSLTQKDSVAEIGELAYNYDGDGGLSKALLGISRSFRLGSKRDTTAELSATREKLRQRFSVGMNLNYYFGSLRQIRRVVYENTIYYNTRIASTSTFYGLCVEAGLHYTLPLSAQYEDNKIASSTLLMAGLTISPDPKLRSRFSELTESFIYSGGVEFPVDSIQYVDDTLSNILIPSRLSGGVALVRNFRQKGSLIIAADYHTQDWSKFSGDIDQLAAAGDLKPASTFSLGVEWNPRGIEKSEGFFDRNHYRIGFRNTATYLALRDHQVKEWGVSTGLSIPFMASKSASKLNMAVEYGRGGTTTDGLVQEDFVNLWVGFSLSPFLANDWFIQRRYE